MKKLNKTVATGLLALLSVSSLCTVSAETHPQVTMEQIVEANKRENFLKDGDSYQTEITYLDGYTEIAYSDSEMRSMTWVSDKGEETQIMVGDWACGTYEGEYEFYLCADDEWTQNNQPVFFNCLQPETAEETIEECFRDGDYLVIRTSQTPESTKKSLEGYGGEYEEGDILKVEYTIDPQTYVLFEEKTFQEKADGTREVIGGTKVTFHAERSERAEEMFRYAMDSEDRHTVTLVLDPDTDHEKTYSADIPAGAAVFGITPDGYKNLYLDRACTEILEGDIDQNEDVVLYSIPEEDDE